MNKQLLVIVGGLILLYVLSQEAQAAVAPETAKEPGPLEGKDDLMTGPQPKESFFDNLWGGLFGMTKQAWIETLMPDLVDFQKHSGIPPAIVASQALAESWTSHGPSGLAAHHNNFFGLTGDSWYKEGRPVAWLQTQESFRGDEPPDHFTYAGKITNYAGETVSENGDILDETDNEDGTWTLTVVRPFRHYTTVADGLNDWYALLQNSRYRAALAGAKAGNLKQFADGLVAGGWATDEQYAQNVINNDASALV